MRCDDKVVLVVGAGSGIGEAAAQIFADNGASVAAADLNAESAQATAEKIAGSGGTAAAYGCDVTSKASTDALVAKVLEHYGRIDSLVTTVGWSDTTFFTEETEEYWHRIAAINFFGSIYLCRSVLDTMAANGGGSIVLTSSDAGKVGTMGETVYAGAKAGIIGFTKSLAREAARDGIRVNAVAPGPTDTPLLRAQSDQHVIEKMIRAVPLKRMGQPHEPANAMVFLASDAASYITGQTISVSGGLTMTS